MRVQETRNIDDEAADWFLLDTHTWSRTVPVKDGEPPLLLRVFPNPDGIIWDEPWRWEVVEVDDDEVHPSEAEIDMGGASSREAAMEAAIAEATAHVAGLADE
jgi:hypothetical protein